MKKFAAIVLCLLLGLSVHGGLCSAQEVKSGDDEVYARPSGDDLVIGIAGYEFEFEGRRNKSGADAPSEEPYRRKAASCSIGSRFAYGFSMLAGPVSWMETNPNKSVHLSADIFTINLSLDRSGVFEISTGFRWSYNDYVFTDDISVHMNDGVLVPYPIDPGFKKSKLAAVYFGMPLYLEVNVTRTLTLTFAGYADYLMDAYTKYKKPVHKDNVRGLNPFQFGVGFGVTYDCFGVYVRYVVSPLFKAGAGPDVNSFSTGIMFNF